MRVVLVTGTTETATVPGISAAGTDPDAMAATPAVDAEIVAYGRAISGPVPVSPTGCPTPALVTWAVRSLLGFDVLVLDAGTAVRSNAPTVDLGGSPGGDIRTARPVPDATVIYEAARSLGRALPDDHLVVGESVPGGTTTALGVARALGERIDVSSSLPENPLARKVDVVADGLEASGLEPGDYAGDPVGAIESMGDPVLAGLAGFVDGALDGTTRVTLAGGTQQLVVAAILTHAGATDLPPVATTSYVADDETVDIERQAAHLGAPLVVTDPGFDGRDHPAMVPFCAGEAKEGVGMGGALSLAAEADVGMAAVRDRLAALYEEVVTDGS